MTDNANAIDVGPYKGQLIGTGSTYWAAIGPGAHVVCDNKEQAGNVAAALNGAYLYGVLQTLKDRGHL